MIVDKSNTYIVYKHVSPNGKAYVGITSLSPSRRWGRGSGYISNKYFSYAIKKYGWDNFEHEILLEGLTKKQAELAERLFIGYWDLTNPNKGYNMENGGATKGKHSEETKRKIGEAQSGKKHHMYGKHHTKETREKISRSNKGKKRSDVTKKRIAEANKGKRLSDETKEKIKLSHIGKRHSEETLKKFSEIRQGEGNPFYGKHHSEDTKKAYSKMVNQINKDTNEIINTFVSIKEAGRQTGVQASHISSCCHHTYGRKTAGGYRWEFVDDC